MSVPSVVYTHAMIRRCLIVAVLAAAGGASPSAAQRTEVVVDNSVSMWDRFGGSSPRVVALRRALTDALLAAGPEPSGLEIGLWTVGGHHELVDDRGCDDAEAVLAAAPFDPGRWRSALSGLYPLGTRPLALAVRQAIESLEAAEGPRRLVLLTSGGDTCNEDLVGVLENLVERESEIDLRIVGIGLDRETANAATLLFPTRNAHDPASLASAVSWALEDEPAKARPVDFELTLGGQPVDSGELRFARSFSERTNTATIDAGSARARLEPGLYTITIDTGAGVEIDGFAVTQAGGELSIAIPDTADATLEVEPELPMSTGTVYIHYWGAPSGRNFIVVNHAGAATGDWLARVEAGGAVGEVALRLPGASGELEARMLHETGNGGVLAVGRVPFTSRTPTAVIDVPDSVEIGTPLTVAWQGPEMQGDHVTLSAEGADAVLACLPARSDGAAVVTAPFAPGSYTVRYLNAMGMPIAHTDIEVFEILATLDFAGRARVREEVEVAWTGPAGAHDFLSLASPAAPPEDYRKWAPVAAGNPLRLGVPDRAGRYEIRYVRGDDHEILARGDLEVIAIDLELRAPAMVRTGLRFEVRVRGTTSPGDFIAIAPVGADVTEQFDWIDADATRPLTLAAPFEPGAYEVRYISGDDLAIRAQSTVTARE